MTKEEHIKIHQELHRKLNELVADWIGHTEGLPSKATIYELICWSNQQTTNPQTLEPSN